jgi:hypothetical protein
MKQKHHSTEAIIRILRQSEGCGFNFEVHNGFSRSFRLKDLLWC